MTPTNKPSVEAIAAVANLRRNGWLTPPTGPDEAKLSASLIDEAFADRLHRLAFVEQERKTLWQASQAMLREQKALRDGLRKLMRQVMPDHVAMGEHLEPGCACCEARTMLAATEAKQ